MNDRVQMNLISSILFGNIVLLIILFFPKDNLNYEIIKSICLVILFTLYYLACIYVFGYYIEKISPYLTKKIKRHPTISKRIFAIIGMIILFFILNFFMEMEEVWKIYGIAIVTYFLSFLVPSNKEKKEDGIF